MTNPVPEAKTRRGWRPLAHDRRAPEILEVDSIELRGLEPSSKVMVGPTEVEATPQGTVTVVPSADENLAGHVGLIEVSVDGLLIGEIELVPDKMSEPAYRVLRADLQRVWTDLLYDPDSVSAVAATGPSARELWRRIDAPIRQILDQPSERLVVGTAVRRMEQIRRRSELRPAILRAGVIERPALTRTVRRDTDTPENRLVAATLQLLKSHARRDPSADDIVRRVEHLLRAPVFSPSPGPVRRVTWGMRSDPRYRQVLAVRRILNRPELAATEGPGELRLGVKALSRIYEYWVYLQVLLLATARYGPPLGDGFEQLAVPVGGSRRRLELPAGTTVTFPGPVHVAFEPELTTRGDGWMGLEYVPHPDRSRQQFRATPDVVVLRLGERPWMTVIDAKYVGRRFVEQAAAKIHEKYSRVRLDGVPIVHDVIAVHPHAGLTVHWAGYGYVPMAPGLPRPGLPVPLPIGAVSSMATDELAAPNALRESSGAPSPSASERVTVIADQWWMHRSLGGRRIDIAQLGSIAAGGRPVSSVEIVMPRLPALMSFADAAERRGWLVHWVEGTDRAVQLDAIHALTRERLDEGPIVVVSAAPDLLRRLPPTVDVFDDLLLVPTVESDRN